MTAPAEATCKGSRLIELVKMVRRDRAAFTGLLTPETLALVEERILIGSWYPEVHLGLLLAAIDRAHGKGDLALCTELGRGAAQLDLDGVYRVLMVPGDPLATLGQLPAVWGIMHNTGRVVVEKTADGARLAIVDYAAVCPAMCATLLGWVAGTSAMAGARDVEAAEVECRRRGDASCVYQMRWAHANGRPGAPA